jgi:hypothetical protein
MWFTPDTFLNKSWWLINIIDFQLVTLLRDMFIFVVHSLHIRFPVGNNTNPSARYSEIDQKETVQMYNRGFP